MHNRADCEKICEHVYGLTGIESAIWIEGRIEYCASGEGYYCDACDPTGCVFSTLQEQAIIKSRGNHGHFLYNCSRQYHFFVVGVNHGMGLMFGPILITGDDNRQFATRDKVRVMTVKQLGHFCELVLSIFGKETRRFYDTGRISKSTQMIIDHIRDNYRERITIEELTGLTGECKSLISKRFKDDTQESIVEYLNNYRVNEGKKLLAQTNMSIVEVAFLCGFENQSYFNRVFSKSVGMTPGQYRKAGWIVEENR